MSKKEIMVKAWEIAREGQKEFGGKISEYLSEAMKIAWVFAKEANVLDEVAEIEAEMKGYQDDIRGRWEEIEAAADVKIEKMGIDEKQAFQIKARMKEQYNSFVNWVPAVKDREQVIKIHANMINFINGK